MTDVSLVFDIDSSKAQGAARALAGLNRYVAATATATAKLETQYRRANGQFGSHVEHVAENEAAIRRLAASYNPALSAQLKFAEAQKEVARAVQLGVISSSDQASILRRLEAEYTASANAANAFANSQRNTGSHTANVFAQLNDIGVMMAAGQNPIQLALQQGTQLNQVWASMGKEGKTLSGVVGALKDAVASMISPMSLLTLGTIAGGAAIVQLGSSLLSSGNDAKKFSDHISASQSAISRANSAAKSLASSGLTDIGEKYGKITKEILSLVEAERMLALSEGARSLKSSLDALTGTALVDRFGPDDLIADLADAFKLSSLNANELRLELDGIGKLGTLDKQADALQVIRDRLGEATNGFTNMTPAQEEMLRRLKESEDTVRQLIAATNRLPGAFSAAASAAAEITDEINRSVRAAAQLSNTGVSDLKRAELELKYRKDSVGLAVALADEEFRAAAGSTLHYRGVDAQRKAYIENARAAAVARAEREKLDAADRESERATSRGAGRSAADLKTAEKGFQSLRELLEKESVFQFAEWEKRQSQLDAALSKNLVSLTNYEKMKEQLRTTYFGTEYEQKALQYELDHQQLKAHLDRQEITQAEYNQRIKDMNWARVLDQDHQTALGQDLANTSAYFGQLAGLVGSGNDRIIKLQRSAAAASALVDAWGAYTKALNSPVPLDPWTRMALAGKVLAAGLGAVNAIKGGGKSAGGSSASTVAAKPAQPDTNIYVDLTDFNSRDAALVETVIQQITDQSRDGRQIIHTRNS